MTLPNYLIEASYQYRLDKARKSAQRAEVYTGLDPIHFLETEMYLADTGQPMTLHPEQAVVIREMFRRDGRGFVYNLMLYSSIKKSAKTTIAAGILLWQGFRIPHGEIYIIGNDLRQADSRMAQAVRECIQLNPRMKGIKLPTSTYRITLPNGTRIETIPVDPSGESGMNPSGIFITEAWGAKSRAHELLWTEARLSPTRQGESFKFVESYAGHSGQSLILERLYESVVKQGTPIPHIAPELYTSGQMIGYWNTRPYLPWQTPEYYQAEERDMLPGEFRRVHRNEWAAPEDAVFRDFDHALYDCPDAAPIEGHLYVAGLDFAQAEDFTALCISDATDYREVHIERWRRMSIDAMMEKVLELLKHWRVRFVKPEKNSIGAAYIERLYALINDPAQTWPEDSKPILEPFVTTNKSKHELVSRFQLALTKAEGYRIVNHPAATLELKSFQSSQTLQNQYTYSAPAGGHDDLVIARLLSHSACYRLKGL